MPTDKWVIVGNGGFVSGSFLPHFPSEKLSGLLIRNPIKAMGLSNAYHIPLFHSLEEAKSKGANTIYICSSSWTHMSYIQEAVSVGFQTIISEKPIITEKSDLSTLNQLPENIYGMMLKRVHQQIKKKRKQKEISFYIQGNLVNSSDQLDPRKGHFLFSELIHYVDIALCLLGSDYQWKMEGHRVFGHLHFYNQEKSIKIHYDFNSAIQKNDLYFYPELIHAIFKHPESVIIPINKLKKLYEILFEIEDKGRNV